MTPPDDEFAELADMMELDAAAPLDDQSDIELYAASTYGEAVDLNGSARTIIPVHLVRDATAIDSMTEALGRLPTPEEALHLWIGWRHSMGALLGSILDLAAPAVIDELHLATLTFSKDNAEEWAGYIDAGQVKRLTVVCSQYFEKTSTGIYDHAAALLLPRGARIIPIRSHCKLLAARMSDGRHFTAEGSANTRSAKTVEQVTLFANPDVYEFHRRQMERAAEIGEGMHRRRSEEKTA